MASRFPLPAPSVSRTRELVSSAILRRFILRAARACRLFPVAEQSETLYDAAGNRVQSTTWQRFHDATGTGPLHGPKAAQPRARRTYACLWRDAIGREIAAADYGTIGGAALVRPEVPPASSETVLVTRTVHASTGHPVLSGNEGTAFPFGLAARWSAGLACFRAPAGLRPPSALVAAK
jgi:hypothetical protein